MLGEIDSQNLYTRSRINFCGFAPSSQYDQKFALTFYPYDIISSIIIISSSRSAYVKEFVEGSALPISAA